MNSPIACRLRGKLTAQVRRVLPAYIIIVCLIVFFSNVHFFTAPIHMVTRYKRVLRYHQVPMTAGTVIPPKIWQTWRVGPLDFEQRDFDVAKTWPEKNPGHRWEVLTDENDEEYVAWHYGPHGLNRPDIVNLYRNINITIVKADLLRYLIIYAEGGLYADIDVEAIRPISKFIPSHYIKESVDMIIGVEIDEPSFANHPILGPKSRSFCQWTFSAKPRLPVMMRLVENIQGWIEGLARERNMHMSELQLNFDEIITGTGPSAFTNAILDHMTAQNRGKPVTWDTFHDMNDSKLVGGVLVLNVEAFAAGQGHSNSGNHGSRAALVRHHYHASGWPNRHPRQNHPMYGEVEQCNWEPQCVATWDKNVAEWNTLSKEEQDQRMIAKQTNSNTPA